MSRWGPKENLTLSLEDVKACDPVSGEGGRVLRAYCPFHGSDRQRSLRVDLETGRFKCFACGAWGYLKEMRKSALPGPSSPVTPLLEPAPRPELVLPLRDYQCALPGKAGQLYLEQRGIPLQVALTHGVGYARPGKWLHKARDAKHSRLVFPHTNPQGDVVNLYGRAVDSSVPPELRHDHLPGPKGVFNAPALREETVFVCEGVFDALSLIAAGYPNAVAIFGVEGVRWQWFKDVRRVIFAFDADETGQEACKELARQAILRGKEAFYVPPEAYRGAKDLNEAWVKFAQLDLGKIDPADEGPSRRGEVDKPERPPSSAVTDSEDSPSLAFGDAPAEVSRFEARWGSEKGWVKLRDPFSGQWYEVRAGDCPPWVLKAATGRH